MSRFRHRKSWITTCGLSTGAGNPLTFFFAVCNNRPVRVIGRAGNRPEITVHCSAIVIQLKLFIFKDLQLWDSVYWCCIIWVCSRNFIYLFIYILQFGICAEHSWYEHLYKIISPNIQIYTQSSNIYALPCSWPMIISQKYQMKWT